MPGLTIVAIIFERKGLLMLDLCEFGCKILPSQKSVTYRSRVKINATVLETILGRNILPGLMSVGVIL